MLKEIKKKMISIVLVIFTILLVFVLSCTMPAATGKSKSKSDSISLENGISRASVTEIDPYSRDYGPFDCFWMMGDDGWKSVSLTGFSNDQSKALIADMQTMNGSDPCGLRFDNDQSLITLKVEEEQSEDDEVAHADEIVAGFLVDAKPYGTMDDRIFDHFGNTIGRAHYLDVEQDDADEEHTITFSGFDNPVVFANVRTYNGSNPVHVRIMDIIGTGYKTYEITFKLEEWLYQDGAHNSERIDFVILKKGIHVVGSQPFSGCPYLLEVGVHTTTSKNTRSNQKVKLLTHYASAPLIITQSQTFNGNHPIVVRNMDIDTDDDSYYIRVSEEEERYDTHGDTSHAYEDIGYLALGKGEYTYGSKSDVVSVNGNLRIKNNTLCNQGGNPVQLKGMSAFWLNWEDGYKFFEIENSDGYVFSNNLTIDWLVADWEIEVLRVPVGVRPLDPKMSGDYIEPKTGIVQEMVELGCSIENTPSFIRAANIVERCIERGIYVILDWHVHDGYHTVEELPLNNMMVAGFFFQKMSERFGDCPNVLFEIWNEPGTVGHKDGEPMYVWQISSGSSTWGDLKYYSEYIIDIIRDYDSDNNDNIVIAPTPCWDQRTSEVVASNLGNTPLDDDYVMYTFHFYAGSHPIDNGDYGLPDGDDFNPPLEYQPNSFVANGLKNALGDIPVFVTEWGTSLYDGGQVETSTDAYLESSDAWIEYMEDNNVSWCNWSISDKNEGASALVPGAGSYGHWSKWALSKSGEYIRGKIKE